MGLSDQTPWQIYASRALSNWGDRLWTFGIGIFMNKLDPHDLRLVAIYGLVMGISAIVLSPGIGGWIDRTKRLTAAITFLTVQNISVAIACTLLVGHFRLFSDIQVDDVILTCSFYFQASFQTLPGWVIPSAVIFVSAIANLASIGSKITVEKDWIVIISENDDDLLAKMNATFRTIDLTCLVIAPMMAGFVFAWTSTEIAAGVIAVWNLTSVFVEYYLLKVIYDKVPKIAVQKSFASK